MRQRRGARVGFAVPLSVATSQPSRGFNPSIGTTRASLEDSSIAFLGQREVANATAAAANDAASQGVSNTAFYRYDDVQLDVPTVEAVAAGRVRAVLDPGRFRNLQVAVDVDPPRAPGCPPIVRVTAIARVDYVFARAVPGGPDDTQVAARSEASPRQPGQEGC